ncbi:ERI1 exoribonuclease 2-like [Contarinia nasturtii]|uniref:ERI1 exoribonuclease 2-like n=1 Tax=Contarinia nasturtii TaxID=265458 RepID=UPI0012D4B7D1|nr:ERI1 exoribonuclease 2-like [Contarinia nasturtii]XP_031628710.1 ERI1 exoribonuclease 2-like [Contarinia nasturtii]
MSSMGGNFDSLLEEYFNIPALFEYLICIDFEATCEDEDINLQISEQKQEIIEFGAVLVNLRSGAVEAEFHEYVRPTHHPILSAYCTNLTGISQALINLQQPFPVVYRKFDNWLTGIRTAKQLRFVTPTMRTGSDGNTAFCSWTNWDLGNYFKWDCARHGIRRPDYLRVWIDGRKIFKWKFNCQQINFEQALNCLNIVRSGNAHSAIDDAKSLAMLMIRLFRDYHTPICKATTYHLTD